MGAVFSFLWSLCKWDKIIGIFACLYACCKIIPALYRRRRRQRIGQSDNNPRIVIVGAGLSGICTAIKLKHDLGYTNFVILERHGSVGGTWYTNTYPGCACDVPSYLYSYSFEQKYDWSQEYASQPEILQYIKTVCQKYDIYKHILLNHKVKLIEYTYNDSNNCNEQNNPVWTIHCTQNKNDKIFKCDIVVNCMGGLTSTNVKYPYPMTKLGKFKNILMHSGKWDNEISFENKKAAIIGTGTSAIQIAPILQKQCEKLYVFQRSPNYIFPKLNYKISHKTHFLYYYFPFLMHLRRFIIFAFGECIVYPLLLRKNRKLQSTVINLFKKHVNDSINDSNTKDKAKHESLLALCTPDSSRYTPGCKRMGISSEWYQALASKNVELIDNSGKSPNCILDFYENGIILKNGTKIDVDIIACATGYNVTNLDENIEIIGKNKVSLRNQVWNDDYGPYCYKGTLLNQFPNYFAILGPGSGVGSNSFLLSIEIGCEYVIQLIETMINKNYKQIEIKREIERQYNEKLDQRMKDMIWTQNEKSWYKMNNGRVHALFPFSMLTWWWYLRRPNWTEFNINPAQFCKL